MQSKKRRNTQKSSNNNDCSSRELTNNNRCFIISFVCLCDHCTQILLSPADSIYRNTCVSYNLLAVIVVDSFVLVLFCSWLCMFASLLQTNFFWNSVFAIMTQIFLQLRRKNVKHFVCIWFLLSKWKTKYRILFITLNEAFELFNEIYIIIIINVNSLWKQNFIVILCLVWKYICNRL